MPRRDDGAELPREGELTQEEGRAALPLKNGSSLLEQAPEHFQALLAIAYGRHAEAPSQSVEILKDALLLRPDGTLVPDLGNVLHSAYHQTAEGPVLINPFRLDDPEQVQMLEEMEQNALQKLLRRIRRENERDRGR
jgi:hypothetical protein